ncbi:MAG: hypothetical protein NUV82_01335 [Candidatus Komeilibacteria bacterium]|nr:hypothetical protein [Candidatus Komeilibacteria bacterium]
MKKNTAEFNLIRQSIDLFPAQIEQGYEQLMSMPWPKSYKSFKNIVICGMGGSALGFDLARAALGDQIKIPIIINSGDTLPAFVNKDSLVILSSYSGDTVEVLTCFKKVVGKARGFILAGGGSLSNMISSKTPGLKYEIDFNPSGQPRWGLGYSVGAFIAVLHRLGAVKMTRETLAQSNITAVSNVELDGVVKKIHSRNIVTVAAEHLTGNAHVFTNQLNETAKHTAFWLASPELNHHFLEGLQRPAGLAKKTLTLLIMDSPLYSRQTQQRLKVLTAVIKKQGVPVEKINTAGRNRLQDSLLTLQTAARLCYNLSVKNEVDPIAIPWVDYFKDQLSS